MKTNIQVAVALMLVGPAVYAQSIDSAWGQFQQTEGRTASSSLDLSPVINAWPVTSFTGSAVNTRATPVLTGGDTISPASGFQGWMLYGTESGVLQGRKFGTTHFNWTNPNLGSAIRCTPAVAQDIGYDHVFVGTEAGVLYWLNQTGGTVKTLNLSFPIRGPIALRETTNILTGAVTAHVYVTCSNGDIVKVNANYGLFAVPQMTVEWNFRNGSAAEGVTVSPLNTMVYFMDASNRIRAINDTGLGALLNGSLAWSQQMVSNLGSNMPSRVPVVSPTLIFGWSGRRVYAYNALTGLPIWNRDLFSAQGIQSQNYIAGAVWDGLDLILTSGVGFHKIATLNGMPVPNNYSQPGYRGVANMHSYPIQVGNEYVAIGQQGPTTKFYSWNGNDFAIGYRALPWATTKTTAIAAGYGDWDSSLSQPKTALYYVLEDGRAGRIQQP